MKVMNDNPPAFPNAHDNGWAEGMSLRDWFAGQAIAASDFMNIAGWTHLELAQYAYSLADAMLAARREQPK